MSSLAAPVRPAPVAAQASRPTSACCFRPSARPPMRSHAAAATRRWPQHVPSQRRAAAAAAGGGNAEAEAAEAEAKAAGRAAAALAADTFLGDQMTVGVGTGLLTSLLLEEVAARQGAGKLRGLKVVPASDVAASEAAFHGVPLGSHQPGQRLEFYFDCADELAQDEEGSLAYLVGQAQQPQPQLHRARELAAAATTCVVLAEPAVVVPRLGGNIPVALEEEGWEEASEELDDMFLGDAELWRRSNDEGVGPRGGDNPYVSPEGHALVDIKFYEDMRLFGEPADYSAIVAEIEGVPGLVAHGLMANVAAAAIIAHPEGPRLVWRGKAEDAADAQA